MGNTWRWMLRYAAWGLLAGLTLLGGVGLLILGYGPVYGLEFCPETFQRREFWRWELPLVGMPLTAEYRRDATEDGERMLRAEGWLPSLSVPPQWHLVWQVRGRVRWPGEAELLLHYLESRDADHELRWLRWSQRHPQLARVLWPAVQRLARQEQYVWIPDLFLLAQQQTDPRAFEQAMRHWLERAEREQPPGQGR